ncbi:hypothetical protein BJG92_01215 [Arthrobacter sp. SO5]|nr:hypothetical protein [Arthrobacter sp. SO5]
MPLSRIYPSGQKAQPSEPGRPMPTSACLRCSDCCSASTASSERLPSGLSTRWSAGLPDDGRPCLPGSLKIEERKVLARLGRAGTRCGCSQPIRPGKSANAVRSASILRVGPNRGTGGDHARIIRAWPAGFLIAGGPRVSDGPAARRGPPAQLNAGGFRYWLARPWPFLSGVSGTMRCRSASWAFCRVSARASAAATLAAASAAVLLACCSAARACSSCA